MEFGSIYHKMKQEFIDAWRCFFLFCIDVRMVSLISVIEDRFVSYVPHDRVSVLITLFIHSTTQKHFSTPILSSPWEYQTVAIPCHLSPPCLL
jgi:hypothetical protein